MMLAALVSLFVAACAPAAPAPSATTAAPTTAAAKPTTVASPATAASPAAAAPTSAPAPTVAAKPAASPAAAASPVAAASPAAAGAAGGALVTSVDQLRPMAGRTPLKLSVNPGNISFLPFFLALNKGYFQKVGLDIDYKGVRGPSTQFFPLLARGEIDVSSTIGAPALFNQLNEGFNIQVVSTFDIPKQGRLQTAWMMLTKSKAEGVKDLADLKGRTVDGAAEGTPNALLAISALKQAGLTPGTDVTLQYRARAPEDMLVLAQQGVDVVVMTEPQATQAEKQGISIRWKNWFDVMPWYQPAQVAISADYLQKNRPAVEKFLEVYLLACREINASNGQWTPDLISAATKYLEVPADVITSQGLAPYYDPNGVVSVDSMKRVQDIWVEQGQVKQPVDVARLIDNSVLDDALKVVGRVAS